MLIRIGRAKDNDYVLTNPTVSRKHAAIEVVDGRIVVSDLNSSSGTYISTREGPLKITYREINDTDTLIFGDARCIVREIIETASAKQTTVERNPITGEIIIR